MDEENLFRAHQSGLNLVVVNAVNNKLLCRLLHGAMVNVSMRPCDDDVNVTHQLDAAYRFQSHVDARSGGAGRGWFRIVRTPAEARQVVGSGGLAVVLGLEVSDPFCAATPRSCDRTRLLAEIDSAYARGVRAVFPMHIFDNMFGGAAMHSCTANTKCQDDLAHFAAYALRAAAVSAPGNNKDLRFTDINFPTSHACADVGYEIGGGQCNRQGLTGQGAFLVDALTSRGILIDTDHSSFLARQAILGLAEARRYPIVSSHTGFQAIDHGEKSNEANPPPDQVRRILKGGGMVAPILFQGTGTEVSHQEGAPDLPPPVAVCDGGVYQYAQALQHAAVQASPYQVAFGSDFNGFAHWPGRCNRPRLAYPLTVNGHSFQRSKITPLGATPLLYDINADGFAHVGMYPDFIAQLQLIGSSSLTPLMHSAEGYIRVWERAAAASVPEPSQCITDRRAIQSALTGRDVAIRQLDQLDTEMKDTTGPNRGKPTREQIAELSRLQSNLQTALDAVGDAVAAYRTTVGAVRAAYLTGKSKRVCMTEDQPRVPSQPAPTRPPAPPPPPTTREPRETESIPVCEKKPNLPQCNP